MGVAFWWWWWWWWWHVCVCVCVCVCVEGVGSLLSDQSNADRASHDHCLLRLRPQFGGFGDADAAASDLDVMNRSSKSSKGTVSARQLWPPARRRAFVAVSVAGLAGSMPTSPALSPAGSLRYTPVSIDHTFRLHGQLELCTTLCTLLFFFCCARR